MGKRLAESGYAVLVVNPFYRMKKAPVVPAGASFADPATRDIVMPLAKGLSPTTHVTDAKAFVSWLDAQAAVDKRRKIGTTGYCMGGPIVMRTAAAVPDRIGAGGSFHGGGLVTKEPDSPHLLVPTMKASFLFAVAENDDQRDPTAKDVLKETYAKAKLPAEIEVYAGRPRLVPAGFGGLQREAGRARLVAAAGPVQGRAGVSWGLPMARFSCHRRGLAFATSPVRVRDFRPGKNCAAASRVGARPVPWCQTPVTTGQGRHARPGAASAPTRRGCRSGKSTPPAPRRRGRR